MIKTIIFDIGGVVVFTDFEGLYSNFAKRIGLSPEFVIKYHQEKKEELLLGNITVEQFWKDMITAGANPKFDFQEIWIEEGIKNQKINKELLVIIKKLRKNYRIGILSNLIYSRLIIDEKNDLYSNFDYIVLSCKEHLKKPDPEFYRLALKVACARSEEAVFIDDKEEFTSAAEAIGIKSIVYTYPDNMKLLKDLNGLGVLI